MLLITSTWGSKKTFKMLPVEKDCPYNEAIYDCDSKVLALISKEKKETLQMLPKLNEFGDLEPLKIGKRANGKDYKEERKTLETFYEYYIEEKSEIIEFLKMAACNAESFDYEKHMNSEPAPASLITV